MKVRRLHHQMCCSRYGDYTVFFSALFIPCFLYFVTSMTDMTHSPAHLCLVLGGGILAGACGFLAGALAGSLAIPIIHLFKMNVRRGGPLVRSIEVVVYTVTVAITVGMFLLNFELSQDVAQVAPSKPPTIATSACDVDQPLCRRAS